MGVAALEQPDAERLVARLFSRDETEVSEALAAIAHVGPESIAALLRELQRETERRRVRRIFARIVGLLGSGLSSSLWLGVRFFSPGFVAIGTVLGVVLFSEIERSLRSATRRHQRVAQALAQFDDLALTGSLLEALEYTTGTIHDAVCSSLTCLLPRLDAAAFGRLADAQRKALYLHTALIPEGIERVSEVRIGLVLATLGLLQRTGDAAAFKAVRRLCTGEPITRRQYRVHGAAQQALAAIEARSAREREGRTLLRAASDPGAPAATLVRPAGTPHMDEKALLLRPGPQASDEGVTRCQGDKVTG